MEAKLSDDQPIPALRYFRDRMKAKHAVQIVRSGSPRRAHGVLVVPAERLLAQI